MGTRWQEVPLGASLTRTSLGNRSTGQSPRVITHTRVPGLLVPTASLGNPSSAPSYMRWGPQNLPQPPTPAVSLQPPVRKFLVPSGLPGNVSIKFCCQPPTPRALRDSESGGPGWKPEKTLAPSTRKDSRCRCCQTRFSEALLNGTPFHYTIPLLLRIVPSGEADTVRSRLDPLHCPFPLLPSPLHPQFSRASPSPPSLPLSALAAFQ